MRTKTPAPNEFPADLSSADRSVYSLWRRAFDDSDEQAACIESLYPQRYHQVGAGAFAGEVTTIDLDGVLLFRERINRRLIQEGSMNVLTIAWVPNRTGLFRSNGMDLEPEGAILYGEGAEFEVVCDPSDITGVAISPEALTRFPDTGTEPMPKVSRGLRSIPAAIATPLFATVSRAFAAEDASRHPQPEGRDALRQKILTLVLAIAGLPDTADRKRCEHTYARVFDAAKRLMHSHLAHSLTIAQLCRQIGVSRRNLFYAFDAVLGISPYQYLRTIRLNAVRRTLKRLPLGNGRIGDLAWEYGFSSPSQFAADYKYRFGELPSETVPRPAS